MNDSEIARILREKNPWWRHARDWANDDPYLRELHEAPYDYAPDVLDDLRPPGLYVLTGPRRVGKSAALRRAIHRLISTGIDPRQIVLLSFRASRTRYLPPSDGLIGRSVQGSVVVLR